MESARVGSTFGGRNISFYMLGSRRDLNFDLRKMCSNFLIKAFQLSLSMQKSAHQGFLTHNDSSCSQTKVNDTAASSFEDSEV